MSARLLMIALDGADSDLLDRWSTDGTLPNIAALRKRGLVKKLLAPAGITDDGLWASFQFARGLGEHGRYFWKQYLASGEMGMAYRDESDRDSFWHVLSQQGHRVAVFDVPKCGLPKPINGIHLTDWLVHGRYFSEPKSYPKELAAQIIEQFGAAPPSRCACEMERLTDPEVLEVVTHLNAGIAQKAKAGCHFLDAEAWDLFLIAFKASHCAGHSLWDFVGPCHPRPHDDYDAQRDSRLGKPLRQVFIALDTAIGELISAAGADAEIVVFSSSDMEQNTTLSHLMPEIVKRLNERLAQRPSMLAKLFNRASRYLPSALSLPVFDSAIEARPLYEILPYNGNCTALRLNLPEEPFSEHSAQRRHTQLMESASEILRNLRDSDTGERVVAAVDRPSTEQVGARISALPDLLVRASAGGLSRAVTSSALGVFEAQRPTLRPGDHAAGGLVISVGDSISELRGIQDFGKFAVQALQGVKSAV